MSLNAIINLAERLLNSSSEQSTETNSGSRQLKQAARVESDAKGSDRFTPSALPPQDAGLFQVKQFSVFSAAAEFLLSQTLQTQANSGAPAPAAPVNAAATPAAALPTAALAQKSIDTKVAATPIVATQFPVANATPLAAAPTAIAAIGKAPVAATANTTANSTQSQLLALNTVLSALGLNASQLAQVDQIAKLIQDFNPLAFTSLLYQLEALAQASAQPEPTSPVSTSTGGTAAQAAPGANATVTGTPAPATTTGITSGTNNAGGFQLQELVIKFSGIQESFAQTGSGAQGGNSNIQLSAFNLQVEEVNLTLANRAGQSVQVTAPQPVAAVTPQTSAPAAALSQSAAA